ncbi:MAG: GNAT family N-acetyltransferase [Microthrixaceae bacterium]
MVDVLLEEVSDPEEIAALLARTADQERDALVATFGLEHEEAERLGQQAIANPRDTSRFLRIVVDGSPVGWLWTAAAATGSRRDAWLLNIEIDAGRRGQGLGRAGIQALAQLLTAEGHSSLDLTVYGSNRGAEELYRSMGFQPLRTHLRLDL